MWFYRTHQYPTFTSCPISFKSSQAVALIGTRNIGAGCVNMATGVLALIYILRKDTQLEKNL